MANRKITANPADAYFLGSEADPAPGGRGIGFREAMANVETRSKNMHVLVRPSLHARLKAIAERRGTSLNETIHAELEAFADREERRARAIADEGR
jgi:hypothetical protein